MNFGAHANLDDAAFAVNSSGALPSKRRYGAEFLVTAVVFEHRVDEGVFTLRGRDREPAA